MLLLKCQEFNSSLFDDNYKIITTLLSQKLEKQPIQRKSTKTVETSTREDKIRKTAIQRGATMKRKDELDWTELGDTDENQQDIIINTTEYNNNFIKKIDEKDVLIDKGMSKYAISSRGCQIV